MYFNKKLSKREIKSLPHIEKQNIVKQKATEDAVKRSISVRDGLTFNIEQLSKRKAKEMRKSLNLERKELEKQRKKEKD